MAEVLLFHHAQGLTPGVRRFAHDLRAAGHIVQVAFPEAEVIQRRTVHSGESIGYGATWIAFSLGAVALQFALERAAMLSPMMEATSITLAGGLLIAAGIYQWTPLKQACLLRCRSPLDFVLTHWRNGARGAFVMGVWHGTYCVGCCWMLMLLLFVGGVMNLGWIAGIAIFVLVEKLVPAGHWIGRGAGVLLIGWGAATLLMAS